MILFTGAGQKAELTVDELAELFAASEYSNPGLHRWPVDHCLAEFLSTAEPQGLGAKKFETSLFEYDELANRAHQIREARRQPPPGE